MIENSFRQERPIALMGECFIQETSVASPTDICCATSGEMFAQNGEHKVNCEPNEIASEWDAFSREHPDKMPVLVYRSPGDYFIEFQIDGNPRVKGGCLLHSE